VAITSIKTGSSFTNLVKYNDFLAGNPAFSPSSYESIASASPSGTATFTFSSISQSYKHLQIRVMALGTDTNVYLRINGVSTASYTQHRLLGDGSTVATGGFTGETQLDNVSRAKSTYPSVSIIDINDYSSTTKNPVVRVFRGEDANGSGNVYLVSGMLVSVGAVSSITFTTSSNFSANTTFALYGIKG
jgi:hypothetical protein